ncbi:MAG: phosphoadenylyl-sulfate reductase [Rhodospirillaceae bacterium]|nr:phosphoadenylyl-sulfate reductase [Rhodospirillaceae bacterium]|tara:strand:- start:857 stop:1603 length:747 start_codon:yes stop_codon:yes gene_type:complete
MNENTIPKLEQDDHVDLASIRRAGLEERLRKLHGEKDAAALLRSMIKEEFPGKIAAVCSFGAESAVLLSLIAEVSKEIPIIFLETGKHFRETLEYRDHLASHLGLTNVRSVKPSTAEIIDDDPEGKLWRINADYCCHIRKVVPLERSIDPFDAWITGRKRFQSKSRGQLQSIELVGKHIKINPLANWDTVQLKEYFIARNLPRHPLTLKNYFSIGCAPCTKPVEVGGEQRSGRWADSGKTECGIHRAT